MSDQPQTRSALVEFLRGSGPDHQGRKIQDILAFDDRHIEQHHDYIQWLFPLPIPSMAVPGSPVLTPTDIAVIRSDTAIQSALADARARLSAFFQATTHWLVFHDHNHLRITRIIASTGLLTGKAAAQMFFDDICRRVEETGNLVSPTSQRYWKDALAAIDEGIS